MPWETDGVAGLAFVRQPVCIQQRARQIERGDAAVDAPDAQRLHFRRQAFQAQLGPPPGAGGISVADGCCNTVSGVSISYWSKAVVAAVAPWNGPRRSTSVTRIPAAVRASAAMAPVIPAPITRTSVV